VVELHRIQLMVSHGKEQGPTRASRFEPFAPEEKEWRVAAVATWAGRGHRHQCFTCLKTKSYS